MSAQVFTLADLSRQDIDPTILARIQTLLASNKKSGRKPGSVRSGRSSKASGRGRMSGAVESRVTINGIEFRKQVFPNGGTRIYSQCSCPGSELSLHETTTPGKSIYCITCPGFNKKEGIATCPYSHCGIYYNQTKTTGRMKACGFSNGRHGLGEELYNRAKQEAIQSASSGPSRFRRQNADSAQPQQTKDGNMSGTSGTVTHVRK